MLTVHKNVREINNFYNEKELNFDLLMDNYLWM